MNRWKIKDADKKFSQPFEENLAELKQYAEEQGQDVRTIHVLGDPVEEIIRAAETSYNFV